MRNYAITAIVAAAVFASVAMTPTTAEAFCCPAVKTIDAVPVSPPVKPRVNGRIEVNECVGLSFLHIIVRANVPNGTLVMAVIPPTSPLGQPMLSDWIVMNSNRGEIVWQGVTQAGVPNGGLTGRTIEIVDSNFMPLAQATF